MSAIMNNPTAALGFRFLKIGEPGDGPKGAGRVGLIQS